MKLHWRRKLSITLSFNGVRSNSIISIDKSYWKHNSIAVEICEPKLSNSFATSTYPYSQAYWRASLKVSWLNNDSLQKKNINVNFEMVNYFLDFAFFSLLLFCSCNSLIFLAATCKISRDFALFLFSKELNNDRSIHL